MGSLDKRPGVLGPLAFPLGGLYMHVYGPEGLGPDHLVCSKSLALGLFVAKILGTKYLGSISKGGNRLVVIAPLGNWYLCSEIPL